MREEKEGSKEERGGKGGVQGGEREEKEGSGEQEGGREEKGSKEV